MATEYLQLAFKDAKFYAYSKTKKEGYEEHVNTKGDTSYRKYYDNITGVLESVGVFDGNFGKQVSLRFRDGEDVLITQFQMLDAKDRTDVFVESLVRFLPNLEKGSKYVMTCYNFIPEGEKYPRIGVSFKDENGEKIKPALYNKHERDGKEVGDIPGLVWEMKMGKNRPTAVSVEARTEFIYNKIMEETERLGYNQDPSSTTSSPKSEKGASESGTKPSAKVVTPPVLDDEDDDLPF